MLQVDGFEIRCLFDMSLIAQLLGLQSHDIDIAIDNMTGFEFVEKLVQWLVARVPLLSLLCDILGIHDVEWGKNSSQSGKSARWLHVSLASPNT